MTVWLGHSHELLFVRVDLGVAKNHHHPSVPVIPMVEPCPVVLSAGPAPGLVRVVRNLTLMAHLQPTCLLLCLLLHLFLHLLLCLLLDLHLCLLLDLPLRLLLDLHLCLLLHLHQRLPALPLCLALCILTRCPPEQWW